MELRKYLVARALDLHKKIGKWIEAEEGQDPAANADNPFIKRIREVQDYLDFSMDVAVYGYDEVRYRQADEQNATPEQLQRLKDLGVIKGERLAFVGGQAQIGGPSVPKKLPELSSGETSTLG